MDREEKAPQSNRKDSEATRVGEMHNASCVNRERGQEYGGWIGLRTG